MNTEPNSSVSHKFDFKAGHNYLNPSLSLSSNPSLPLTSGPGGTGSPCANGGDSIPTFSLGPEPTMKELRHFHSDYSLSPDKPSVCSDAMMSRIKQSQKDIGFDRGRRFSQQSRGRREWDADIDILSDESNYESESLSPVKEFRPGTARGSSGRPRQDSFDDQGCHFS